MLPQHRTLNAVLVPLPVRLGDIKPPIALIRPTLDVLIVLQQVIVAPGNFLQVFVTRHPIPSVLTVPLPVPTRAISVFRVALQLIEHARCAILFAKRHINTSLLHAHSQRLELVLIPHFA